MSGHSKWAKIHRKKGAADAQRGKIFSKHSKLISIAAKGGPEPELNPSLALAIANAKKDNMPANNIDKAIKAGAGLDKDAAAIEEILYEGYGPSGIAIMVQVLTDNKNRSASEIRHALSKNGGSLGTPGSVAFQFEKRGEIIFTTAGKSEDGVIEVALEAGATDFEYDPEESIAYCSPTDLHQVRTAFTDSGIDIQSAKIIWHPQSTIEIEDVSTAQKIMNLIEAIDDLEDVDQVTANFDISEDILSQLE